jgi:hypothetical protein
MKGNSNLKAPLELEVWGQREIGLPSFPSYNLMNALIRNAKRSGILGLRFAGLITSKDELVALSDGQGRVRRQRECMYPLQHAGNGPSHWL